MIAYDTELTGIDIRHGCRPFFFSFCDHTGKLSWVEWDVDPYTRLPNQNQQDIDDIADLLCSDRLLGHNIKVDLLAFEETLNDVNKKPKKVRRGPQNRNTSRDKTPRSKVQTPGHKKNTKKSRKPKFPDQNGIQRVGRTGKQTTSIDYELEWLWDGIDDTLVASHCLRNLWNHSLKSLRRVLLYVTNEKQEALRQATNQARNICRTKSFIEGYGKWRLADKRDLHWPAIYRSPSEKDKDISGWWLMDTWLPRAIATLAPEYLPDENNTGTTTNRTKHRNKRNKRSRRPYPHNTKSSMQSGYGEDYSLRDTKHSWFTVLRDYGIEDVETTMGLWWVLEEALKREGLWEQYLERRRLLEITYDEMEREGVTLKPNIKEEREKYKQETQKHKEAAIRVLPIKTQKINLNSSDQLRELFYQDFGLPVLKNTKKSRKFPNGQPSTDADTITELANYTKNSTYYRKNVGNATADLANSFFSSLILSRKNTKAEEALNRFYDWSHEDERQTTRTTVNIHCQSSINGDPFSVLHERWFRYRRNKKSPQRTNSTANRNQRKSKSTTSLCLTNRILHNSINITGTKFTRQSTNNPNLQNVATGKEEEGHDELLYNLRCVFGPREGEYWLVRDYSNLELRLWAYDCGSQELIDAYERGESAHIIIFRILWPKFDNLTNKEVKELPQYKWTKNGNFSIIYGAAPYKADKTYQQKGAYNKIAKRLPETRRFTEHLFNQVREGGYVETMTGYRLYIPTDEPHVAVSGRIQGTAGSIIGRAMIDTFDSLKSEPSSIRPRMILQVHDELVFSFPEKPTEKHLGLIKIGMEKQGDRIGIPTPTDGKLITTHWGQGEAIK